MIDYQELLARCPRCRQTVILTYGRASYRNLAVFDSLPWTPDDEPVPEGLTDAAYKRWRAQLPYKLYVCYIDFEAGTWEVAMARTNEKLRPGQPLWKPHNCLREESDGMVATKADLVPDRPGVAMDVGYDQVPSNVESDRDGYRPTRPVRRRRGGL